MEIYLCYLQQQILKPFRALTQTLEWRKRVSMYGASNARHTRLRSVLMTYLMAEENEKNIENNMELAHILGWLTELVRKYTSHKHGIGV